MIDDSRRIRGGASLFLAVLIGVSAIGCTVAAPGAGVRSLGDQSARNGRNGRLAGDPYQAGTRAPQKASASHVSRVGLTGTHPGGGGPQE